jgi:Tol biopolymer transport system component/DNA-binding winged helix-turn-helix (wHTH) protein
MSREENNLYEFGPYRLDAQKRVLLRDGEVVPLAPKAIDLLVALVENSGHVLSKDELMKAVWPDSFVEEANISHHIFTLRKVLGEDKNGAKYIETIPRRGYRFVATVIEVEDEDAELLVTEHTRSHIIIEEEQETGAGYVSAEQTLPDKTLDAELVVVRPKRWRTLPVFVISTVIVIVTMSVLWLLLPRPDSQAALPPMTAVPFTTYPDNEFGPRFSPDGKLITFSWTGGEANKGINIYVKQVDGGGQLQLTHNSSCRNGPGAFSPDGRLIAFPRSCTDQNNNGLYVIPSAGGPERKLYSSLNIRDICWSPDGKFIAFADKTAPDKFFGVSLLSIDTLEIRELSSPSAESYQDRFISISPDSEQIAFIRASGDFLKDELYVVSVSSGEQKLLFSDNSRMLGADWTPNGKEIIFSSNRSGSYALWRISAAGGEPQPMAVGTENAADPTVSRQGNLLAYTRINFDANIYKINLPATKAEKASSPVRLIASTRMDRNPRLSADGKQIVFESNRTGSYEIWTSDSDGKNEKQLTFFGGRDTRSACWSPDGQQIAFISRAEGHANLYTINVEGLPPRRLSDGSLNCAAPSWSRDGQWIYFASDRIGSWQVWKMPAAGGEPLQVTSNGGYEAMESLDGRFVYYNKYGFSTEGIFRIPVEGGQEIRVFDLPQLDSLGDWTVTDEGIYFVHRYDSARKVTSHFAIKLFSFNTDKVTEIAALDRDPVSHPGLNISPDRRWLIYSSMDSYNHDIMLVKNFR